MKKDFYKCKGIRAKYVCLYFIAKTTLSTSRRSQIRFSVQLHSIVLGLQMQDGTGSTEDSRQHGKVALTEIEN